MSCKQNHHRPVHIVDAKVLSNIATIKLLKDLNGITQIRVSAEPRRHRFGTHAIKHPPQLDVDLAVKRRASTPRFLAHAKGYLLFPPPLLELLPLDLPRVLPLPLPLPLAPLLLPLPLVLFNPCPGRGLAVCC